MSVRPRNRNSTQQPPQYRTVRPVYVPTILALLASRLPTTVGSYTHADQHDELSMEFLRRLKRSNASK